jgi:hypothetical protein
MLKMKQISPLGPWLSNVIRFCPIEHGVEIKLEGGLTMGQDTGARFRKAVDAISLWIGHTPYPQTDREWRKLYLELDAEVKKALPHLRQSSETKGREAIRASSRS